MSLPLPSRERAARQAAGSQSRLANAALRFTPLALGLIAGLLLAFVLVNREHQMASSRELSRSRIEDQLIDRTVARLGDFSRARLRQGLSGADAARLDAATERIRALGGDVDFRLVRRDGLVLYTNHPATGRIATLSAGERAAFRRPGRVAPLQAGSLGYIGLPASSKRPAALLELGDSGDAIGVAGLTWRQYLLAAVLALLVWLALRPLTSRAARARSANLYRARPRIVRAIMRGIPRGEFELHYQPQIDVQTGMPVAVEALLRWRRNGEYVMPGAYLPDAEASGAIVPLTNHVLDLALARAGEWHRGGNSIRVAVNLSSASLGDLRVVERIKQLLVEHDVPPAKLTVEVTETAVLDEPEQARAVLDAIGELGVDVSVDDFGIGYSSLLWLRLFPVSEVKIDRTFVSSMDEDGEAFVAGVIRMGHDLGLRVVGEGIEDRETLARLQELGCDIGQGFLFAKAMPPEEVGPWFAATAAEPWAPRREEIAVGSGAAGLDDAREMIQRTAAELGYDDDEIWDLKFAATEALTNALDHGAPSTGQVHLRVGSDRGEILVEVWGGEAGGPRAGDPSRGRGIAIMSALMDDVELSRRNGGTVVRLSKRSRTAPLRRAARPDGASNGHAAPSGGYARSL